MSIVFDELNRLRKEGVWYASVLTMEVVAIYLLYKSNPVVAEFLPSLMQRLIIYGLIIFEVFVTWLFFYIKLPHAKRGKYGIVLAISVQSKKQEQFLKDSLFDAFSKQIDSNELRGHVQVLPIFGHKAKRISAIAQAHANARSQELQLKLAGKQISKSIQKDIHKWIRLSKQKRTHMCIWGKVTEGHSAHAGGGNAYGIDMECLVTTGNLSPQQNVDFNKDMGGAFNKKVVINESEELEAFPLEGEQLFLSVKYIISMAAVSAGKTAVAVSMLTDLRERLSDRVKVGNIEYINNRIHFWLSEAYTIDAIRCYRKHNLVDSEKLLLKAQNENQYHYDCQLLLGRILFGKRELRLAREAIERARTASKGHFASRFSLAFLYLYEGTSHYKKAHTEYRAAYESLPAIISDDDMHVIGEIILHIEEVLASEPSKGDLHFALGFIRLKIYKHNEQAKWHFRKFLSFSDGNRNAEVLRRKASQYISEANAD